MKTIFEGKVNGVNVKILADRESKNNMYLESETPIEFNENYIKKVAYNERTAIRNKGNRKLNAEVRLIAYENVIRDAKRVAQSFIKIESLKYGISLNDKYSVKRGKDNFLAISKFNK